MNPKTIKPRLLRNGLAAPRFVIAPNHRQLMRSLWRHGPLSRWELHEQTGLSPNQVGTLAEVMINQRLVRECAPQVKRSGRPRVPLEIDPAGRHLIGLAIAPGGFTLCRLGLSGVLVEQLPTPPVNDPGQMIDAAATQLSAAIDSQTLSIGVTVTGYIDPVAPKVRFSSALPGLRNVSLAPLYHVAGNLPLVLGNDMHAMAARWLLTQRAEQQQDALLVWFADGRLGAAVLIDGRPNRGCFTGANELGHTRHNVETSTCFCGQSGCLERIVSTDFLLRQDATRSATSRLCGNLANRVAGFGRVDDPSLQLVIDHLCRGLSNAVNFIRPHRLVLASPLLGQAAFADTLTARTKALFLPEMADSVEIDLWDCSTTQAAEDAGWLAAAEMLWAGWDAVRSPAAVGFRNA